MIGEYATKSLQLKAQTSCLLSLFNDLSSVYGRYDGYQITNTFAHLKEKRRIKNKGRHH